jgi:hypothetical protein
VANPWLRPPLPLQMDLDATVDQMIMLLSRNPGRIYKRAYYRKQTKNQWARDDPGFVVLQVLFLLLAAVAWAAVFRSHGFWGYVGLMAHAVLLHWLLFGVIAATLGQSIANTHLLAARSHSVEQRVEWLYAFDIHCNAFFTVRLLPVPRSPTSPPHGTPSLLSLSCPSSLLSCTECNFSFFLCCLANLFSALS